MELPGQPPMPPEPGPEPHVRRRPDFGPDERSATVHAFSTAWAITRWILLVLFVGLAAAGIVAVVIAALFTLVDSSV
jgi:hypothetical protein